VSDDGTARVMEVTPGGVRALSSLAGQGTENGLQSVAFSPDGERVLTGDWGGAAAKVWDVSPTGGAEWVNVTTTRPSVGAHGVDFAPDGRRLYTGGDDGSVTAWSTVDGRRLAVFADRPADAGPVTEIAVSPDGEVVATAGDFGQVDLWDAGTGSRLATLPIDVEVGVATIAWHPDGQVLAVVLGTDRGGEIRLMDRSGELVGTLLEDPGIYIRSVAFSADGATLVANRAPGQADQDIEGLQAWDWASGERGRRMDTPAVEVAADAANARVGVTREVDGDAEVWDVAIGEQLATLPGTAATYDIAVSPTGDQVATAGADGVVRLWDAATGEPGITLATGGSTIATVVFSPEGSRLASVSDDGVVRVWALDIGDLVELARHRVTRALTDIECRQYLHAANCDAA